MVLDLPVKVFSSTRPSAYGLRGFVFGNTSFTSKLFRTKLPQSDRVCSITSEADKRSASVAHFFLVVSVLGDFL